MLPRVLLVDDQPDVIEAVKRHLDGCDVHTATTLDGAREELRLGAFELVLCDPSVGDVESLAAAGPGEARPKSLIIARGGAAMTDGPTFVQPESGAAVDWTGLRSLLSDPAQHSAGGCAERLRRRAFGIVAAQGEPLAIVLLLDVVRTELDALYVAYLARDAKGARVLFDAQAENASTQAPPVGLIEDWKTQGVRAIEAGGLVWTAVLSGQERMLLAAFEAGQVDQARAFAECAEALAEFLARCAVEPGSPTTASVVLNAVYSLVHDTRNFVTGLALCLGAYRQNRLAGKAVSDEEIAVLDRQVLSLGAMCREYARVETAMRPESADFTSDAAVNGFAVLLGEFGVRVDSIEAGQDFSLPPTMRGTLSRALLHVALALLELRAAGVRIKACKAGGWEELRVSFRSRVPAAAQAANDSLREAMDLLSTKGAKATVKAARSGTEITMSFAQPSGQTK